MRERHACLALLFAVVFASAWVRVSTAFHDPNFSVESPEGMLRSDPALLYYITERVIEAEGRAPADFRADPRIAHPGTVDIPATFTVGGEFLVAWGWRMFGGGDALHVFCVKLMALLASLTAIGVYGLTFELTRAHRLAALAALLWALLPAGYRTIGFVLVREDLSLPLFALHLWLVTRAARVGTRSAFLLASLFLGAAVSTWHAMGFIVALESAAFLVWFFWSGENPLAKRGAWVVPVTLLAVTLLVPALRAKGAYLSLPLQIAFALGAGAAFRRSRGRLAATVALLSAMSVAWVGRGWTGQAEYGHVFGLLFAKVVHLGRLPANPNELSFDTRLMWQGPFQTLDPLHGLQSLGIALVPGVIALALAARSFVLRSGSRGEILFCLFSMATCACAGLVARLLILPAIALPVGTALVASYLPGRLRPGAIFSALTLVQAILFARWISTYEIPWYQPAIRQAEIAALVNALPAHVPEREAVAADFVNSTAILAHTGRSIVLHPKYETRASRERARVFLEGFYRQTPEEFARTIRERFQTRYLLVDRATLWFLSRYTAGVALTASAPEPGSAAALLLSRDPRVLEHAPGYRLLWRSPQSLLQTDGTPSDFYRLFELVD